MMRSNPAEIIRTMLEIVAEYQIEQTPEFEEKRLAQIAYQNEIIKRESETNPEEHNSLDESSSLIYDSDEDNEDRGIKKVPEEEGSQIEQLYARITDLKAQQGCFLLRNYDSSNLIDYYVAIIDTPQTVEKLFTLR